MLSPAMSEPLIPVSPRAKEISEQISNRTETPQQEKERQQQL